MLNSARSGRIDLILTKSISRFSRNILDTLTTTRELRKLGVEVYFEENHLSSLDPKCELMLSILGGLAQEESRNLSENIRWGIKRKMEKGEFTLPYARFLGYKKGENGRPEIVKREARIIREIYMLFLNGRRINQIIHYLNHVKRKAPGGGVWYYNTVLSILTNEKYAGVAVLQKTYTPDYLTHKAYKNTGEMHRYLIHRSHPAIIDIETFKRVQRELKMRRYKVPDFNGVLQKI